MKTYVGKGKEHHEFALINFSVCLSDLPKESIFEYNGNKYIKLTIAQMKKEDEYGKTHTVYVDEFKPEPKDEGNLSF